MEIDQSKAFNAPTCVRVATIDDAADLAKIAEKTFRDSYTSVNSAQNMDAHCTAHFSQEQQSLEILDQAQKTLLLECDGLLSGFSQLCWHKAPKCYLQADSPSEILRFYLGEQLHGTGAAQTLMNSVLDDAKKTDTDVLWLGVWEHNFRALAFYRKQGFVEVGEHTFQLGTDRQRDLIMVTTLN
jgi:ribosomal protein S18 acetylase RimI-like enzyme